jgi:tRNA1Val (adenine37-N6)-methyltransferase
MKVCTDACLFGAWVAKQLEEKIHVASKIMDIGTGTGLLSLMLAQKTNAEIDAIEMNDDAYVQATENVSNSIFKNSITTFHCDILHFNATTNYDLIICNPPFYENQLQSPAENKNAAMHESTLSINSLFDFIKNNISENGHAALILPYQRMEEVEKLIAEKEMYIHTRLNVKHTQKHPYFRSFFILSNTNASTKVNELSIKTDEAEYSEAFVSLLKDYYLHL